MPILGSWIGNREYILNRLSERLFVSVDGTVSLSELIETIKAIDDPHCAFAYLYYCCNYSKVMHLLRTIPRDLLGDFNSDYDRLILDAFQCIIESPIDVTTATQVRLNLRNGGMGLRALISHSLAANISSFNQCKSRAYELLVCRNKFAMWDRNVLTDSEFADLTAVYRNTTEKFKQEYNITEDEDVRDQKYLSSLIDDALFEDWYDTLDIVQKTRVNACRAYGASAWIGALPVYRSYISPRYWITIARLWNGLPMFVSDKDLIVCPACNDYTDNYGHHPIACPKTNGVLFGWTLRHNIVRNILFDWMNKTNYCVEREKYGLCPDQSRPADIYVHVFNGTKPALIDVGVTSPMQTDFLTDDKDEILIAAEEYAGVKTRKYDKKLDPNLCDFIPFICEVFGGIGEDARVLLKRLSYELQGTLNKKAADIINEIKRDIVISILKSNAKMIMDRIPYGV